VAGILRPTHGEVEVLGRTAALIELGAGFHPEISGRENVYINGAILGLTRREIEARYDAIVEFSGLADFIEEPVKNYSSGMYVRLGFAVAIHTDPEILLVDEVLSVGDESFGHRCLRRIEEFLAEGGTLLLVSHSLDLIESVCDRAIWIERGTQKLDDHPRRVVGAYRQSVAEEEGRAHQEAKEKREHQAPGPEALEEEEAQATPDTPDDDGPALRWGSGEATISEVRLLSGGEERYHLATGEDVIFRIEAEAHCDLDDVVFGVGISTPRGIELWGSNTDLDGHSPANLRKGGVVAEVHCDDLRLAPGEYLLDVAIHTRDGAAYDYRRQLLAFSVTAAERGVGLYFPRHTWSFTSSFETEGAVGEKS
jgi:ABC-type polysaccharide/polyol phosphate transport system ATPase subunit